MPHPDESLQLLPFCQLFSQMQMQYRASVSTADKMKLEPGMISFMENTTSTKLVDQNGDFSKREVQIFLSTVF